MHSVHFDIRLAVTVFDDIDNEVVDDFSVICTNSAVLKMPVFNQMCFFGILAIFAEIGNDVGYAHHATLKCGRD